MRMTTDSPLLGNQLGTAGSIQTLMESVSQAVCLLGTHVRAVLVHVHPKNLFLNVHSNGVCGNLTLEPTSKSRRLSE